MTAERAKHSRFGASVADRWLNCPGSVLAAEACPPRPSSAASREGTAAHALAEHCLLTRCTAASMIGSTFEGHVVSAEMAEAVQVYLDYVNHEVRMSIGAKLYVEQRVELGWLDSEMFGTSDAIIVAGKHAIVIDYKHGYDPVEADKPQMAYYALEPYWSHDCETFTCVIVQPRAQHWAGPIRAVHYTREQMGEWADKFREGVHAARKPNAPRAAGAWCKYCPAAGKCETARGHALAVAKMDFPADAPPAPRELTPAALSVVLSQADVIETWLGNVRSHALALAEAGTPIPGYKLVEGRAGNRKWASEAEAARFLVEKEVDPYAPRELITPAQAEKKLKAKVPSELVTQTAGKTALVPDEDARIGQGPSAITDFM